MPVLAIDTTTLVSSVALAVPGTLLGELTFQTKKTHSERLMPHIAALLSMADIGKSDLTAVAVSIGPGSFTGLRIGLASAKALSYTLGIPLIGVPTLAALAYGCYSPASYLAPMLDAQKGNVYMSLYRWKAGLQEVKPAQVYSLQEALTALMLLDQPVVLLGEAAIMYREKMADCSGNLSVAPAHCIIPKAGSAAMLAIDMLSQGVSHDPQTLEPLYIRRSEAEELWEKRHGGPI